MDSIKGVVQRLLVKRGREARSLPPADDPGSAVLTLTSLGLIRRSYMPSETGKRHIALA